MKSKPFNAVKVEVNGKKKQKIKSKPAKSFQKPQEGFTVKALKPVEDNGNFIKVTRSTLKLQNDKKKASKSTESIPNVKSTESVLNVKSTETIPNVKSKKVDSKINVKNEVILEALRVLKEVGEISDKKRNVLFDEAKPISLHIECIKIPECVSRKLRFTLPNWLITDTSDVCLFVSDLKKGSRRDHEPTIHHYEDLLKEKGITNVKTVIPMRQVRVEFDQMEMKRRLLTQYDFFLADARISGLLAHKLGVTFFRKNQMPTPVKLDAPDLKEAIDKALHKTVMKLHGTGHTYSVPVANGKHTEAQACENIQAVLLQLDGLFPGTWNNVRSVFVKHPLSLAIPIYMTLKNKNTVGEVVVEPLLPKQEMVEGDLTTILGAKVKVFPGGEVKVNIDKSELDEDSDDPSAQTQQPKLNNQNGNKSKKNKKEEVAVSQPKKRKISNDSENAPKTNTKSNADLSNSTISEDAEPEINSQDSEDSNDESESDDGSDVSVNDEEVNEESDGSDDVDDSDDDDEDEEDDDDDDEDEESE